MTKHAIDRAAWSPEERDEYEDMLAEICNASPNTSDRLDLFEQKIVDAIQAHRPWANDVARSCRRFGMGKELARFQDRNRALVSYDGQLMSMPSVQSRKVVVAGEVTHQRELLELWTWDQLREKRGEALKALGTYTVKVGHYDRLLALSVLAPDTATPAEASAVLGIDLDEYLAA